MTIYIKKILSNMDEYRINYLHRLIRDELANINGVAFTNFFIVKMPEEMGIDVTDIVSFEFTDKKKCRIVIRDNFVRYPIFTINEYIDKRRPSFLSFLHKHTDNITVEHIGKKGDVKYTSVLEDICVDRVWESKLTYDDDGIHTITLDISFKKRVLNQYGSTDKE